MVLMTVLWILLVISFIAFALAAAVRTELSAAGTSFDSERALFMAKGAAETVFLKIQNPDKFPQSSMREERGQYVFQFDSGEARVKTETDASRIDLNGADEKVLASMFASLGIDEGLKNELVDSILDWRDSDDVPRAHGAEVSDYGQVFLGRGRLPYNSTFNTMQELLLVKHMTPDVYFGRPNFEAGSAQYRKGIGLRDIATVGTGRNVVDANTASVDVLAALPGVGPALAAQIVSTREQKRFADNKDLSARISGLNDDAASHLTVESGTPTLLISTATLQPSGTRKTVQLRLRAERQKKIITSDPVVYKEISVVKFGNWEY
jgi:type II secretory pathway component PulK